MQYNELLFGLFNNLKALYQKNLKFPNISFQQILAISTIENSGVEMSYFSKRLGIDNSTATRLIDGLEKKKLVERKRNSSDNRVIKVFLTKRGEKINSSIEFQLEKISYSIEKQFDESSKGEIIESGISLNWAIIKYLNR
jgi:DNA-binding MarR family transcriptional regulator